MTREIKFHGKRVEDGKWINGDLIHETFGTFIQYRELVMPKGVGAPEREPREMRIKSKVIPETVGQYIGLPDIKGKDVYEGDVSKTHYSNGAECYEEIVYRYGEFRLHRKFTDGGEYWRPLPTPSYCYSSDEIFPEWIEVIGSIHDNPFLINGEANE